MALKASIYIHSFMMMCFLRLVPPNSPLLVQQQQQEQQRSVARAGPVSSSKEGRKNSLLPTHLPGRWLSLQLSPEVGPPLLCTLPQLRQPLPELGSNSFVHSFRRRGEGSQQTQHPKPQRPPHVHLGFWCALICSSSIAVLCHSS
jgi:hypothetical protein